MLLSKRIEKAVGGNPDAKARFDAVVGVLTQLVVRCASGDGAGDATQDLIRMTAVEVVEAVLRPPEQGVAATPPWSPPRYHLPNERKSLSKDLLLPGMEGLKVWVGFFDDGAPAEIFVDKRGEKSGSTALLDALATSISIGLQFGIPWDTFRAKLERWTFEPRGMTDDKEESLRMVSSPLDYLIRAADVLVKRWAAQTGTEGP